MTMQVALLHFLKHFVPLLQIKLYQEERWSFSGMQPKKEGCWDRRKLQNRIITTKLT